MRRLWELSFILCLCFSQNVFGQQTEPANGRIVQLCSDGEPVACPITLGGQNCYISSNAAPKCSTKGEDKSPYFKVEEGGKNYFHLVCTNKAAWKKDTTYNGQSIPRTDTPVKYHKIDLSEYKGCYLPCPNNCDKCDIKNGVPFCSHCPDRNVYGRNITYYVTNSGQCSECPSNCGYCPNGKDLVAYFNCYMNNGNPQSCPTGKYSDEISGKGIEKCKTCPTGCTKCTYAYEKGKVWCQSCDSDYTLDNGQCIKAEYSIMFTDKGGNKTEQNKLSFHPGTAADIMEQFWTIYDSAKARCSVGDSEILCTCAQTGTGSYYNDYFMSMERCNSYKAEQEASNADGVFCETNDATDNICPIKSTRCSANCLKCQSTDTCDVCREGYTWNSEKKKCLPPITPLSCPEPLKYSNDGRCCVL